MRKFAFVLFNEINKFINVINQNSFIFLFLNIIYIEYIRMKNKSNVIRSKKLLRGGAEGIDNGSGKFDSVNGDDNDTGNGSGKFDSVDGVMGAEGNDDIENDNKKISNKFEEIDNKFNTIDVLILKLNAAYNAKINEVNVLSIENDRYKKEIINFDNKHKKMITKYDDYVNNMDLKLDKINHDLKNKEQQIKDVLGEENQANNLTEEQKKRIILQQQEQQEQPLETGNGGKRNRKLQHKSTKQITKHQHKQLVGYLKKFTNLRKKVSHMMAGSNMKLNKLSKKNKNTSNKKLNKKQQKISRRRTAKNNKRQRKQTLKK